MSFNWITTAVLSAAVQGFVNTVDSHLISRRLPSFRAYMLPVGIMILGWSIVLVYLFPLPQNTGSRPLFVFLIALTVSRFSPVLLEWQTEKSLLTLRFFAITMIVGGVAIIYLT